MVIKLEKNKQIIIRCLIITIVLVTSLASFGILSGNKALYLGMYLLLSIVCFLLSADWISTLTLFWLQYTIYSLGYLFSKTTYLYNPFFVVLGSFALLLVGYCIEYGTRNINIKIFRIKRSRWIRMKWKTIIHVMYVFSSIMWGIYIAKNRVFLFGGNLESGRVDAMSGNGVFLYAVMLHVMYIPLLYILLKKNEISRQRFYCLVPISCAELISLGFRTPLVIPIFCILVIKARLRKFSIGKAIPYFLVMFVLAMLYEMIRAGNSFSFAALLERFSSRFDVCMWNYNFVVTTFPKHISFQHGYTNVIDLIMLLPGPGQDFSLWLKDAVGIVYDGGGLVTFIQGSFYIDFGIPGMMIGMLMLGYFKAKVDKKLISNPYISFWNAYLPYALSMVCGNITGAFILPMVFFVVYKVMEHFAIGNITLEKARL